MDVFSFLTLGGGVAFFLYGMHVMSAGLEKLSGGKLEQLLKQMTSNVWKSLFLGMGLTIAIQSSSALTVMLVGLVNSGIMQLYQTIGIIMGSNIGTTLTAWLLSLVGIESSNVFVRLLKPESFSPILAVIGILLIMTAKQSKKRDTGNVLVGFSVLMFGMQLMSDAVSPLAQTPEFSKVLVFFENPILGVLVGAIFTGIIQSSAASVGILQALSLTGSVTFGMTFPIIMGQNIGTCVTALLSSIGVNRNAKRVAVVHVSFNVIGTVICLLLYYALNAVFRFEFVSAPISPVGIALCHSVFNVFTTFLLLPFRRLLEQLSYLIVPKQLEGDLACTFLDERLLESPSLAVAECSNAAVRMAELAKETLLESLDILKHYDEATAERITNNESLLDSYEDHMGSFLVRIASHDLTEQDSRQVSKLLHVIGDFERIGDHAVNLLGAARELHVKHIRFSSAALGEVDLLVRALTEILSTTIRAYETADVALAATVEPLEQVIDGLTNQIKIRHVERLQQGSCTIELGFILSDLLNNFERVSDHCSNIAVCVIEVAEGCFDTHAYLSGVKQPGNEEFLQAFRTFSTKYQLSPIVAPVVSDKPST